MSLSVTNTLSGEREPFEPRDPESVLLYYCGLTTYDPAHLGHARAWIHVDVMHRWLEHLGYDVRHVENFTDVNEKIVAEIGEKGDSEAAIAREMIGATLRDMRALNLKRATVYPRVSEHIPEVIELVERLIDRGYAYESNGSVYFDITEFDDYGKLSNQDLAEIESQGDPDERSEKRHPADFALWKAGEAHPDTGPAGGRTWDAPWSEGRPGWHIECSAMSMAHLDESIDIHVGGQDLVFPHHENEIAQSEAVTGEQFAEYWLHIRLLETGGEKMSSSLGNFFYVEDAVETVGADVVRMFLLSSSYNNRQDYSEDALAEAEERWERLERAYERAIEAANGPDAATKIEDGDLRGTIEAARADFAAGMNDDFNTREALAALLEVAAAINRHLDDRDRYDYRGLRRAIESIEELGGDVLGFTLGDGDGGEVELAEELIELVLAVREDEREAGNYERADTLRDDLEALGITVEDTDDGPTYRR